jgi:hypothetical protein
MRTEMLIRAGGVAAMAAGVLRAAGSFAAAAGTEIERQSLYFVIDLLLLLGVFAAYGQNHKALGRTGAVGFLTTVVGVLLVRSTHAVAGVDLYPAGAFSVVIGWVLISLAWKMRASGPAFAPLLFVLSIVFGLVGQMAPTATAPPVLSGLIFGAAIVGVGKHLLGTTAAR